MKRLYEVLLQSGKQRVTYPVVARSYAEATDIAINAERSPDSGPEVNLAGISRKGLVWPWRKVGLAL